MQIHNLNQMDFEVQETLRGAPTGDIFISCASTFQKVTNTGHNPTDWKELTCDEVIDIYEREGMIRRNV